MHIGFRMSSSELDSRYVQINCPVCQHAGAGATAVDLRQTLFVLHVVPIFHHRPTIVTCQCSASLVSTLRARDLVGVEPQFAARYLNVRVSPILKALVFGGLVAWMLPVIGSIWTGIGYFWARQHSGWIRTMALAVFVLSLLPTCVLLFAQ
jgi:hypothetical protein